MLLTPEQIQQAIKDAHQKRPRVILPVKEIYEAIARAQHRQDVDFLEKYVDTLADSHVLLIIPRKHWQSFKEAGRL